MRLFSIRHEFPTEWANFKSVKFEGATRVAELTLVLRAEHYPFWSQGRLEAVKRVDLFAKNAKGDVEVHDQADLTGNMDRLVRDDSLGSFRAGKLTNIPIPMPTGDFTLYFDDNSMEDLWLAITWGEAD